MPRSRRKIGNRKNLLREKNLLEPDVLLEEPELPEEGEAQNRQEAFHADWTKQYKLARKYLYGGNDVEAGFFPGACAVPCCKQKQEMRWPCMIWGGCARMDLGVKQIRNRQKNWYRKGPDGFPCRRAHAKERKLPYLWYRIGKMYACGARDRTQGKWHRGAGEENLAGIYASAAAWFSKAVSQNHKYAQYSLAGLYYRGQGVEQDFFPGVSFCISCLPTRETRMHLMTGKDAWGTR